jgi:hypothetical protein
MSAPLTDDQTTAWDTQIRAIASHLVKKLAYHQDQTPLIDDLTAAGWIALLEHGPETPHIGRKIRQAILDSLALWLWGVTWGQAPRHLTVQYSLEAGHEHDGETPHFILQGHDDEGMGPLKDRLPMPGPTLEARTLDRVAIQEIWDICPEGGQQVMILMAEAGERRLASADYTPHGLTKHTVHDARVRLQQAAARVMGE